MSGGYSHCRRSARIHRADGTDLEIITGPVQTADRLADLPLPPGPAGPRTLAVVPYRQIAERGFACVDDGVPLEFLTVTAHRRTPLAVQFRPESVLSADGVAVLTDLLPRLLPTPAGIIEPNRG